MIGLTANMIEEVSQVFIDVQTELAFFALAIVTHLVFFKGFNTKLTALGRKNMDPPSPRTSKQGIQKGLTAGSGPLLAFKTALRAGELKSAMAHFEALQSAFQRPADSPSSAPQMLMEQLVKLAGQKGELTELLSLVAKMGVVDNALDLVLAECASQGDSKTLRQAEELARSVAFKFTPATYQALIKGGSTKDARELMSEAQKAGVCDMATYTTYIKGLLKKGSSQEVHRVLEYMRTAGMHPNTITFNGLISAVVASNVETAWSLVDEMKAFKVSPDQVTCSILLKGISGKSTSWYLETVMTMLDDLTGEVDEVLISSVVEATVRVGRADLLMPFLKKQRASRRAIAVKGPHTYASLIRAYGYVQDVRGAWDTWNEMRRQHIMPISVTLGCMVEALVTNGDIDGGYELIQEMLTDEKTAALVNAVIFGSIIKGCSHNKRFDRLWQVYDEMVERKLQFSMVTFNTLIDACARSGELHRIPALLKDIEAQGLKMGIVTYSAILKGYCQTNRLDSAFELLDNMQQTTQLEPDEIMFNTLLDGCARQGLYDRGMALLEKMKKSGVRPSNFTLSVLVKLANRGKKLEKAFEICDELTSTYKFRMNVHVFDNLVQACIHHHDLPRAIGILERMLQERVRPDLRTYSMLLRACIETREVNEAAGLLRSATGLPGAHPRLAKFAAAAAKPQGGLPGDLVSEIVRDIISCDERLAATLLLELGRVSGLKLDPKLRLRLAARMADH